MSFSFALFTFSFVLSYMSEHFLEKIILDANRAAKNNTLSEIKLGRIKRVALKSLGIKDIPQNTDLIPVYHKLVKSGKISPNPLLEKMLRKKKMRSLSGIASITVITPDFGCPGKCIYCPTEKGMPKSYLSNEPAVMRAITNKFNPYMQVSSRLKMLKDQGHPTDKIELIIAGGTWSAIPEKYQIWFIANCYGAANSKNAKRKTQNAKPHLKTISLNSLKKILNAEQKKNETAKNRIVGLTLETRPDWINERELVKMREFGCTRVEIGVQSIYDNVLKKCERGHTVKETILATKLLKDFGFKINYHIMLGLPGSTIAKDTAMIKELFTNPNFQPDMLKIYPCVVLAGTKLDQLYKAGKYKPLSDKQIVKILKVAKTNIPEYCRVVRVIRDIPTPSITAGGKISNLREIIHQEMAREGKFCRCIRCREIKDLKIKANNLKLKRIDYEASGGQEIFLSFDDAKNDKLVALLRLRIPSLFKKAKEASSSLILSRPATTSEDSAISPPAATGGPCRNDLIIRSQDASFTFSNQILPTLQNSAIIRELHTYGQMEEIAKGGKKSQHLGLGKKLMKEAEKIAKKEFGAKKIAVISGIGARNYYKKLGYKLKDTYLVKNI